MDEIPVDLERFRAEKLDEINLKIKTYFRVFLLSVFKEEVDLDINKNRSSVRKIVYEVNVPENSILYQEQKEIVKFFYDRLKEDLAKLLPDYDIDLSGLDEEPSVLIIIKHDTI